MRQQRGQTTVLIGIIFQVVFIFFAMVINVGLLINDKINLQNSVDIAAYYGAMKQAEVLNTIAHINYQIRQAWKLLNWRLWVLGDAGRILNYEHDQAIDFDNLPDEAPQATSENDFDLPLVCVRNSLWWDEHWSSPGVSQSAENWCKKSRFTIKQLQPLKLGPFQMLPMFSFLQFYQGISEIHAHNYAGDCNKGGPDNYYFAALVAASYKIAVAHRRNVIRELEKSLMGSGDFTDISGQSVRQTVETVLKKNLTLANKQGLGEVQFINSLSSNPFLVPIDVHLGIKFADISGDSKNCTGTIKDILTDEPTDKTSKIYLSIKQLVNSVMATDYTKANPVTAQQFLQEDPSRTFSEMRSLVGFEKNPWVAAYVQVKATAKPSMLFSPSTSGVTLVAESIAMPFGGRIGPSYRDSWQAGSEMSSGTNKIDQMISPRVGEPFGDEEGKEVFVPNYSRYPGDQLGMKSRQARVMGLKLFPQGKGSVDGLPHLHDDDYGLILEGLANDDLKQDPVVYSTKGKEQVRQAELLAISPDLFDAAYYSVDGNFEGQQNSSIIKKNAQQYLTQISKGFGWEDFGTSFSGNQMQFMNIENQLQTARQTQDTSYWKLVDVNHLRTSWAQKAANDYTGAADLVGNPPAGGPNPGGRVGYSVKIVSEDFLSKPQQWGGPQGGEGVIRNPPQ